MDGTFPVVCSLVFEIPIVCSLASVIRFSWTSRKAWRASAAGFFFLLAGVSFALLRVPNAHRRNPPRTPRTGGSQDTLDTQGDQDDQDDQDDLALPSRGVGRLAEIAAGARQLGDGRPDPRATRSRGGGSRQP